MPDASDTAEDIAVDAPAKANKPAPGFREALKLFILGALGCTLIITVVAVREWLAPWMPLAIGLGVAGVLSASISFLYCEREQKQAFARGLAICLVLALPMATWLSKSVRERAVQYYGASLAVPAKLSALGDPAEAVRVSACAVFGAQGLTSVTPQLVDLFKSSPALGARCVQQLAARDQTKAADLAHRFVRRWDVGLARGESQFVCQASSQLFAIDFSQEVSPAREVTVCAMTTDDDRLAKCCANALTERYTTAKSYADALGSTDDVAPIRRHPLFVAMVPHAFRDVDATRRQLPNLERELMRKKPVQDWVLALGCGTILSGHGGSEYAVGLEAAAASQGCPIGTGDERQTVDWQDICWNWQEDGAPDDLCKPLEQHAQSQAREQARIRVHKAIATFKAQQLHAFIDAAGKQASFQGRSGSLYDQLVARTDPSTLPAGVGNADVRRMMRLAHINSTQAMPTLGEQMPDYEHARMQDYTKMVRQLQQNRQQAKMTWTQAQKHMTDEQRRKYDPKVEKVRKQVKDKADKLPANSPLLNVLR